MSSNDYHGPERRNAARSETDLYGSLRGGAEELRCKIVNLSRIGACAVSPTAFPDMAQVRIRLTDRNPDGSLATIQVEAAVVRCQRRSDGKFDVGLFFTSVTAPQMEMLDRIVSRTAPVGAS